MPMSTFKLFNFKQYSFQNFRQCSKCNSNQSFSIMALAINGETVRDLIEQAAKTFVDVSDYCRVTFLTVPAQILIAIIDSEVQNIDQVRVHKHWSDNISLNVSLEQEAKLIKFFFSHSREIENLINSTTSRGPGYPLIKVEREQYSTKYLLRRSLQVDLKTWQIAIKCSLTSPNIYRLCPGNKTPHLFTPQPSDWQTSLTVIWEMDYDERQHRTKSREDSARGEKLSPDSDDDDLQERLAQLVGDTDQQDHHIRRQPTLIDYENPRPPLRQPLTNPEGTSNRRSPDASARHDPHPKPPVRKDPVPRILDRQHRHDPTQQQVEQHQYQLEQDMQRRELLNDIRHHGLAHSTVVSTAAPAGHHGETVAILLALYEPWSCQWILMVAASLTTHILTFFFP